MAPSRSARPNILFFFTDDQRHDTIHALGNLEIATPSLDRLVESGTAFTRAHIMGGSCGAVCMPSRAMLMTGRTLYQLEGQGQTIPAEHLMLPELLQRHGYQTFGTGKWHNGPPSYARCFETGDRVFFGGMSDHFDVPLNHHDPSGAYPPERIYHERKRHSSDLFAGAAIEFLRRRDRERPFFCYIPFTAPHDPRDTHPRFHAMYDATRLTLAPNLLPEHPFDNGDLRGRDECLAAWPRTPESMARHLADYYAMITHADAAMGQVLEALDATGDNQDTIVVFAGDNGLALGQHGLMGKQNLYDHSLRVPLIVGGPGVPRGETRDSPCYLLDIYPTLCDLIGVDRPASVQGRSLAGTLADASSSPRDHLLFAYRDVQRAVRDGNLKLIDYAVQGRRTTQLFDLERDPWEQHSLAADPDRSGDIARLVGMLQAWRDDHGDASPFWETYDRAATTPIRS
jgi:arylsulfatase A-like enzyme